MMRESRLGAAILGFFGAIKICREEGYDPREVFETLNDDARVEEIIGSNPYEEKGDA